ncbi:MAG: D-alanine--D-alanine ligase [Patescibacteria group bacterium]
MKRIGVLLGGPSSEHDISVLSGLNVLRALEANYEAVPIFITRTGEWLFGAARQWLSPIEALLRVDGVFNALHGEYGEDGHVQRILERAHIPYTGAQSLASAVSMNKAMAHDILAKAGLRIPRSMVMGKDNLDMRAVLAFGAPPWIVKPRSRGSSVGVSKVSMREQLPTAFEKALAVDTHLIVQEFIPGREITCGVLENFGGRAHVALAPIEIIPPADAAFFDYQVKYNGKTQEICPAEFYGAMLKKIQETALAAHHALGLRHYSRTDMIIKTPEYTRRAPELYVLEVNTLPGLTSESLFPRAARHAGLEFPDLVNHLVKLSGVV